MVSGNGQQQSEQLFGFACLLQRQVASRSEVEEVMGTIFPKATLIYVPVVKMKEALEKQKKGEDLSSELARG